MRKHKGGSIPGHPPPTLPSYKAPYKGHETLPQVKSPWPSKRSGGALSTSEIKAHNDAILAAMTNEQRAAIPRPRRYSQPGMLNSSGVVIKDKDEMLKIRADRAKANADAYNRLTPEQKQQQRDSQIASQHQEPGGVPYVSKYMQHLKERNAKREAYDNSWIGKANKAFFTPVTRGLADAGNFLADYGEKIPIPGMKQLAYAAKLSKAARGEGKPRFYALKKKRGGTRSRSDEIRMEAALRRLALVRKGRAAFDQQERLPSYPEDLKEQNKLQRDTEGRVMKEALGIELPSPYWPLGSVQRSNSVLHPDIHHSGYMSLAEPSGKDAAMQRQLDEQFNNRRSNRVQSYPPDEDWLPSAEYKYRKSDQKQHPTSRRGSVAVDGSGKGKRRVRRVRKDAYRVRVSFM